MSGHEKLTDRQMDGQSDGQCDDIIRPIFLRVYKNNSTDVLFSLKSIDIVLFLYGESTLKKYSQKQKKYLSGYHLV